MTEPNMEWEKKWETFVLHDAVIGVFAGPEIGDKFEPEKYNYANKKLNELNEFIYTRGKELIGKLISEAEQRGYEKGAAEERRRISTEIRKMPLEYADSNSPLRVIEKILSLIHDTK